MEQKNNNKLTDKTPSRMGGVLISPARGRTCQFGYNYFTTVWLKESSLFLKKTVFSQY